MNIEPFYDKRTSTLTYVVWDDVTKDAVVVDPVLDYDANRVHVYEESLDRVDGFLASHGLNLRWVLETHAHADHLSGADRLRRRHGAKIAVGERIVEVQATFAKVFDVETPDRGVFDRLLADGDVLEAGGLRIEAIATPGHTPACMSYRVGDAVFTGDALFLPDSGTGRCDFPNGSAGQLWSSVQRLYALPDDTRVFVGHDYQPGGREVRWQTTIGESRRHNVQLTAATTRDAYVAFRTSRDATLSLPNLLFPSLQANIRAGALPDASPGGRRFLRLPIDLFDNPQE